MKRLLIAFLIFISLSPLLASCAPQDGGLVDSGMDYTESTEALNNPWRGFYFPMGVQLKKSGNGEANTSHMRLKKTEHTLLHLRVGLEAFSSAAGGTDDELTADALRLLGDYFTAAREEGVSIIFRMSYDLNGNKGNCEPALSLMERHIEQVSCVLADFEGTLAAVESGMLGPWGEQHSTTAVTPANVAAVTQKWLDCTEGVTVSVRRPLYFVYWYNARHGTNYTIDTIDQIPASQTGTDEYLVGVYNDGYLGSASDLGTYTDRAKETAWLSAQAAHTLFGGEVAGNNAGSGMNEYNDASFLEAEGFVTHTTYLNIEWNDKVVAHWRNNTYNGNDPVYKGKTSELKYIENHLGYRFVLRDSRLSESAAAGGTLKIKGRLENVGFAPLVRQTSAKIILAGEGGEFSIPVSFNPNNLDFDFSVTVPQGITGGTYTVYLAFNNGLALANNGGIYDAVLKANKIGTVVVR